MKNINSLVKPSLVRSVKSYDKLSQAIYSLLHLNKKKHNVWVVVKQQKLTILTDNPYLGTQLQYQQQAICEALNTKFLLQLNTSRVKIVPPSTVKTLPREERYVITEKAGSILSSIADQIDDEELRNSLKKLAKKSEIHSNE